MADKLLKSITFPDLTDKYIVGDTTLSVAGAGADAKATGDALATKANTDGSYENLTAGTANQINTSVRANDKTPYIFRTSGGSVDIGDREYINGIVGGTVAWNQLAPIVTNTSKWIVNTTFGTSTTSGNALVYTITVKNGSQSIIVSNSVGGIPIAKGHKIFTSFYMTSTEASSTVRVSSMNNQWVSMPSISANTKTLLTKIYESDQDTGGNAFWGIYPNLAGGLSVGTVVTVEDIQVFDLTQMFGSTIADYIYSLETANAGAGVAWFKKLFPKPYYEYNAGELLSVSGLQSHDMTGFNQWDEEWRNGYYDEGVFTPSLGYVANKNPIRVVPNTIYCLDSPQYGGYVSEYDASGTFILRQGVAKNSAFTVSSNTAFINFQMFGDYGGTYKNDICINISWDGSRNGEYEPYVKHSYPLDSDLTLRGIPKLDADNKLYYDGDIYPPSGEVARKYGIRAYQSGDESLADAITDGTNTVYKLTTPTTETADPYTSPQIVDDFGTEEYVISDNTFEVPVGHDTDYPINMVAKLEMAPNSPDGNGDYIVRQTNGMNEYVPLVIEDALPTMPSTAGTYKLTVTVAEGSDPVLSWEAE